MRSAKKMVNSYKQRRKQRRETTFAGTSALEPVPRPISLRAYMHVRVWHVRDSNSIIYVWKDKLGKTLRAIKYRYKIPDGVPINRHLYTSPMLVPTS